MTLSERLGFGADDRLLIICCDNLGCCHAANVGAYEALRDGVATTASLMVPAPWAREAVSGYRGSDVGVHLTLNSEFGTYRWGPITQAPSLLDGEGGFPRRVDDLWDHADLAEVRRECRAQIERAIVWGFDVSHLDSHLSALNPRPEFFDVYLDMAIDFGLPIRLDNADAEQTYGFNFRKLAHEAGVLTTDHVVQLRGADRRQAFEHALADLAPGVTEIALQPAVDTPEIQAITDQWEDRTAEHRLLTDNTSVTELIERSGAKLISWTHLRDAQRG